MVENKNSSWSAGGLGDDFWCKKMASTNVTTMSTHCPQHLMVNEDIFDIGEYENSSEFAHQFLGFSLLGLLLLWSTFILKWPTRMKLTTAYKISGLISFIAGAYLFMVKARSHFLCSFLLYSRIHSLSFILDYLVCIPNLCQMFLNSMASVN
jgi:hypothetical protein